VVFDRRLGGGVVMMLGVFVMAVREMRMVARQFVVALEVMLMGGVMMLGSLLVVLGGVGMVLGGSLGVFHDGVSLGARFC
jgi:hypothetical protein